MSVHLTIKKNSWRRLAINRILWIILFLNDENSLNINYLHTTSLSLVFLLFIFFLILNFYFYFILLYNTVLVLAYIDMSTYYVQSTFLGTMESDHWTRWSLWSRRALILRIKSEREMSPRPKMLTAVQKPQASAYIAIGQ